MKRTAMTTAALCAVLCTAATTYGYSINDYRTKNDDMTWGDNDNWERWDGDTWVDADYYPNESGGPTPQTVYLQHRVTVDVSDAEATVLDVDAELTIESSSAVNVTSYADIDGSVIIDAGGVMTVGSHVDVDARIDVSGTLTVGTYADVDDCIYIYSGGTMTVGTYAVVDASIIIYSGGTMTVGSYLIANASITVGGTMTVGSYVIANASITVSGTMNIGSDLEVNAPLAISGAMIVNGLIEANASITIGTGGALTVYGLLDVNADITTAGMLITYGDIDLDANIIICANGTLAIYGEQLLLIPPGCKIEIRAANSSNYGTLQFGLTCTVEGTGQIEGTSDRARISIDSGMKLTNEANIKGCLQIIGSASFDNDGVVEANVSGTLLVNVTGSSSLDGSSGTWKATTSSSATLEFGADLGDNDSAISMVSADFYISHGAKIQIDEMNGASIGNPFITTSGHLEIPSSGGTLDCRENVTMGGPDEELDMDAGSILVAPGKAFIHD